MRLKSIRFPTVPTDITGLMKWAVELTRMLYELVKIGDSSILIINSGLAVDRPTPSGSGELYWATDTDTMYYDPPI
jgi:hypothetical protein